MIVIPYLEKLLIEFSIKFPEDLNLIIMIKWDLKTFYVILRK